MTNDARNRANDSAFLLTRSTFIPPPLKPGIFALRVQGQPSQKASPCEQVWSTEESPYAANPVLCEPLRQGSVRRLVAAGMRR
jgi:hypothetical protein